MAGTFFRQFRATSTDWMVGAFVGATLDFFFSMIKTRSHILNTLSALIQITCATLIVHEFLYAMGMRGATNTLQGTWVLTTAIWWMSPNAVNKLRSSYYAFHRLLYGTRSIVEDVMEASTEPEESKKEEPCSNNCDSK